MQTQGAQPESLSSASQKECATDTEAGKLDRAGGRRTLGWNAAYIRKETRRTAAEAGTLDA
jgi:hypothetical protein